MSPMGVPEGLEQRIERVRNRIADAGGDPDHIALLAVTKGFGPEVALAAARAGLVDLGENYAQELVAKAPVLAAELGDDHPVRWHFIGRLQRNKVRTIAADVHLWQTVDRLALASRSPSGHRPLGCWSRSTCPTSPRRAAASPPAPRRWSPSSLMRA